MARGIGRPPPVYLTLNKLSYLILSLTSNISSSRNTCSSSLLSLRYCAGTVVTGTTVIGTVLTGTDVTGTVLGSLRKNDVAKDEVV